MGAKVSSFVADVGKAVAKAGTSFVLGKIPVVGSAAADWINRQYAKGGKVIPFADGGAVASDKPKMVINTPAQLIALVKKVPEIAQKHGLTPELIKEEVAKAKEGEVAVAKRRGGRAKKSKKAKEDRVVLESGEAPAYARGGLVPSVF
jgi:hypothetical protein